MAEVRDLSDAFSWPLSRLADCFGMHRQTLTKRVREAGLRPSGTHRGNPIYSIQEVAEALYSPGVADSQDPDSMNPQDRKAWYDSEKTKRSLEEKDRLLIPCEQVEEVIATGISALAQGLRSLPDTVERRTGCSPEVIAAIERVVDAEMDSLADKISEIGASD